MPAEPAAYLEALHELFLDEIVETDTVEKTPKMQSPV